MSTFGGTQDKRRAYRLAQRLAAGNGKEPLQRQSLAPGVVQAEHASISQLLASGINFDRAGFAFDITGYTAFTVNGQGDPGPTLWTKVGSRANNLRISLGSLSEPIYVWIWSTFGWANNGAAADSGRCVPVLYDSLSTTAVPIVRAQNIMSDWRPSDNNFRNMVYIGFIGVNPDDPNFTGLKSGEGDWNIGMQMQFSGLQKAGSQSVNRQSLIVFVSAFPDDGVANWSLDTSLQT